MTNDTILRPARKLQAQQVNKEILHLLDCCFYAYPNSVSSLKATELSCTIFREQFMTTAFSCSQQNNARTPFQQSIQVIYITVSAEKCCYWCVLVPRTKPCFIRSLINFNTVSVFAQSCPTLPLMNFITHKSTTLPQWEAARSHALMRTS